MIYILSELRCSHHITTEHPQNWDFRHSKSWLRIKLKISGSIPGVLKMWDTIWGKKTFANNMAEKACKNVCQMFENSEIQTQISQYITLIISYPAKCK